MRLLVIGGTRFVGRGIVEAALAAGHDVTLMHRGKTGADLFPEAEHLLGDRETDLHLLDGRTWDAVIDVNGYVPRVVRSLAEKLQGKVGQYTFISTVSVYADPVPSGADENAALQTMDDPTDENIGQHYGALKVLCENVVSELFPGHALIIRPGLVIGPEDYTDRFTWWVRRVGRGGEVLAPGRPERRSQGVDYRDLGAWTVQMTEQGGEGAYNSTGPDYPLTFGETLDTAKRVTGSDAQFVWVDEAFLLEQSVRPFMDLPFWLPEADNSMLEVSTAKANAAGLKPRPLADTIRDIYAWDRARASAADQGQWTSLGQTMNIGLTPEREAELLTKWKNRT